MGKLTLKDVDLELGRLWITRVKGGVAGEYAFFRDTQRLLKLYMQQRDGDLNPTLFVSRNKNPISIDPKRLPFNESPTYCNSLD